MVGRNRNRELIVILAQPRVNEIKAAEEGGSWSALNVVGERYP